MTKNKTGIVLMYGLSGPEYSKLRQIFAMLRVRMHPVNPDRYHVSLKDLAAGKGEPVPEAEAPKEFGERMLVFCYMNKVLFHQILEVIRLSELPPIGLKAVLTQTNQEWDSTQLYDELMKEREAIKQQLAEQVAKKKAEAEGKTEEKTEEKSGEAEKAEEKPAEDKPADKDEKKAK